MPIPPPSTAKNSDRPTTPPPSAPVRWHWNSAMAGALLAAIVLGGLTWTWRKPTPPPIAIHAPPQAVTDTPQPTATPAPLFVFITGAVQSPGVYTLPSGARVVDVLTQAGGFTVDANVNAVNQAAPLRDGDQVYIPTLVEEPDTPTPGLSSDGGRGETISNVDIGDASGGEVDGKINVNTATAEELDRLPGIGPARAADIIANRPYISVDDLDRVPGIGPATLEKLRPLVVVE